MNAIYFAAELEFAEQMQAGMLPEHPPVVPGLDIWAAMRPAFYVSGDYYDFFLNSDQSFSFVMGDICGKGISAAILMSMFRIVIRYLRNYKPYLSPKAIIQQVNNILYEDLTKSVAFATLFIGSYDPISRSLLYANAGHSPIIFIPSGQGARFLKADGIPVGVQARCDLKNHRMKIESGDVLIIGTDGLVDEINSSGDISGYQRLLTQSETLVNLSAHGIGEILTETSERSDKPVSQNDDRTIIVIKSN